MKKLMIFLLIAALLTGSALAESAGGAFDLELDEDIWLSSCVMIGGRLYLVADGEFCLYTPGAPELEKIAVRDERPQTREAALSAEEGGESAQPVRYYGFRLFADGESLYAADLQNSGMIYPLALEEGVLVIREGSAIDTQPLRNMEFGDDGYVEDPLQMLGHEGRLYLINRTWSRGGQDEIELFSYDLEEGGEAKKHEAEHIWRLAPYKDGKLLALVMDPEEGYDPTGMKNRNFMLCAWNLQDDSLEQLGDSGVAFEYEAPAFYYDRQADMAYIQGKTEVWRVKPGGQAEICAYLMPSQYGGSAGDGLFLTEDGRLLNIRGRSISLRENDPAKLPKGRLRLYGSYMNDAHKKAMQALGGIPVSFSDVWYDSAQTLGQVLLSGDDSIDIFVLNSAYFDTVSMMKKGYMQELGMSEALKAYADGLYPQMREAGSFEGRLYMVPVELYVENLFSYYSKLAERAEGFELPHTYDELVDAIQNWNDELSEQYPDFTIMQQDDFRSMMVRLAIAMQKDWADLHGQEFSFGDPQLKRMLERALSLETDNIAAKIDWRSPDAQEQSDEVYSKAPMLESGYWFNLEMLNEELTGDQKDKMIGWGNGSEMYEAGKHLPLSLAVREGEEPVLTVVLSMMAVNPRSKNLDAAIAYVEAYVNSLEEGQVAMMNPGLNHDIINSRFEKETKWMEEYEAQLKQAADKAEGAEKTEAEQRYQQALRENEKQRELARYSVRASTIAYYRDLMRNCFVKGYDPALNSRDIEQLLQRLTDGQIPLEQFTAEADGKLRLMRLEGQ